MLNLRPASRSAQSGLTVKEDARLANGHLDGSSVGEVMGQAMSRTATQPRPRKHCRRRPDTPSKVVYFAGYKHLADRYRVEDIEAASDVVV